MTMPCNYNDLLTYNYYVPCLLGKQVKRYRVMKILLKATLRMASSRLSIQEFFGQELDKYPNRTESKENFDNFSNLALSLFNIKTFLLHLISGTRNYRIILVQQDQEYS
jgi:hypothetical protein